MQIKKRLKKPLFVVVMPYNQAVDSASNLGLEVGLVTLPDFRHWVHALMRRTRPFSWWRTDCRLGSQRFLVLLCAWDTLYPVKGRFPHISQTRAIIHTFLKQTFRHTFVSDLILKGKYFLPITLKKSKKNQILRHRPAGSSTNTSFYRLSLLIKPG